MLILTFMVILWLALATVPVQSLSHPSIELNLFQSINLTTVLTNSVMSHAGSGASSSIVASPAPASSQPPPSAGTSAVQRRILKAHSGGGGGAAVHTKPIRRTSPQRRSTEERSNTHSPSRGSMQTDDTQQQQLALTTGSHTSSSSTQQLTSTTASSSAMLPSTMNAGASMQSRSDPMMSDKQSLCIDILVNGYVNSFVDFFYLTHRAEDQNTAAAAASSSSSTTTNSATLAIPDSQLPSVKHHLTTAEQAHRRGESEQVYSSYDALAHAFHAAGDYKTSVYFFEKCLDLAESMDDVAQQCSSNHNLGLTHDAMGDVAAAIRFHEKHKELAQSIGASHRIQTANQHLIDAYRRLAEHHERSAGGGGGASSGSPPAKHASGILQAIELYQRCLDASRETEDLKNEGLATYRLGVAYANMGERNESIEYQQKYLAICKKIGDQVGEGQACAALAHSFKELGQTDLAVSYLEKYQTIAQRNHQSVAHADACSALGSIHSTAGDHQQAVQCFEKTFEIARGVGDRKLIDAARINLGMARGNMSIHKYMNVVKDNLPALLNWKTRRQAFKAI